jgi:starvation-inducible DNA-binding protein
MNRIGIDKEKAKDLADKLNVLLSNYQVFYMNVRGFHWNIQGREFFELHQKFEDLYDDLQEKIDEIAERILTLGHEPIHTFGLYLKKSDIKEQKSVHLGSEAIEHLLDALQILLKLQRDILQSAGEADDEGSSALMSDYIREQEKLSWMYSAYLN